MVQVLEGDNAVLRNREIMGATNPANAAPGTVRADFAESIEANSVHGSDSAENAANEIAVGRFLKKSIGFLDIVKVVERTLEKMENNPLNTIDDVLAADSAARRFAEQV